MLASGTRDEKPKLSFQTDIRFALHLIGQLIIISKPDDQVKNLDDLDKYIKDLKLNLKESKGSKVEIDFANKVLACGERLRDLLMQQKLFEQGQAIAADAIGAVKDIVDATENRRRSQSPYGNTFATGATEATKADRNTPSPRPPSSASPRLSSLSITGPDRQLSRSASPHPMHAPEAEMTLLKDEINALKVKVDQYYLKKEQKMDAKKATEGEGEPHTTNKGTRPKG